MTWISLSKILETSNNDLSSVIHVLKKPVIHVYLSGPIFSASSSQEYREILKQSLKEISSRFIIHDPAEYNKLPHYLSTPRSDIVTRRSIAKEAIMRDLKEISSCDLLIAYSFIVSAGTSMEIFFFNRVLGKPVILVYQPTRKEEEEIPIWLLGHCNLTFKSIPELCKWLRNNMES